MIDQDKEPVFIGDPHGCVEELVELIDLIKNKVKSPRIIIVGDTNDRGPDSVGCVRLARELNLECILGNHEAKFLKWHNAQGTRLSEVYDSKKYYHQFSEEDVQYIMKMPLYIELDDVIAIHGGMKPKIPVSQQPKDDLCYLRYTDKDRNFVSLKTINKIGLVASGAKFWTEFGPFEKSIVYGHNVWDEVRIDRFDNGTACYGIDTGCCFGNKLSAIIFSTKEIVEVKAKKTYYKSDFSIR